MFEQVIGQQEVQERLLQMVNEDRLPHAMMLCGPQGAGKLALAVGLAQRLLATKVENSMFSDTPEYVESPMLKKLEHPDLHFTYPTIKLPSMGTDHER